MVVITNIKVVCFAQTTLISTFQFLASYQAAQARTQV